MCQPTSDFFNWLLMQYLWKPCGECSYCWCNYPPSALQPHPDALPIAYLCVGEWYLSFEGSSLYQLLIDASPIRYQLYGSCYSDSLILPKNGGSFSIYLPMCYWFLSSFNIPCVFRVDVRWGSLSLRGYSDLFHKARWTCKYDSQFIWLYNPPTQKKCLK